MAFEIVDMAPMTSRSTVAKINKCCRIFWQTVQGWVGGGQGPEEGPEYPSAVFPSRYIMNSPKILIF